MSSLSKNIAYSIVINVLNVAIPIITVPYVSRVLGVENIGIVNFASTYATYFTLFIVLGIPTYGVREIGKLKDDPQERNRVVSELISIMSISTLFFSAMYVISIFSIPMLRTEWPFLLIAGAGLLFAPMAVDWYFIGRENIKVIALRTITVKIIGLAALFIFVRNRDDILWMLIITVFLTCGSQVWNFFYMLKKEVTIVWRGLDCRRHLKPVTILSLSTLAISIYTMLDTLMLGFLSNYTEVGYYSSAIKISKLLLPIVTSAALATLPRISQLYKDKQFDNLQDVVNKSFNFMSLLAPPFTIGLIVISPVFVPLFFGVEFVGMTPSMMIVSTVVLLIGISNFYGPQVLIGTNNDKPFMYAVIVGMVCNFTLNLIFIPLWGSVGASIASVIAEAAVTIIVIIYAMRLVPQVRPSYRAMVHSIVASLPMIFFGWIFIQTINDNMWATMLIVCCSVATFVIIELFIFRDHMAIEIVNRIFSRVGIELKHRLK